jgi:hypothetical protein
MSLQSTPEDTPKPASETPSIKTPPDAMPENTQKTAQPAKPAPQTYASEVTEIIRQKCKEASEHLRPIMSATALDKAIEDVTKRIFCEINEATRKYFRNTVKMVKILPQDLVDAVLDQHGIKRTSRRAEKNPKKSPPVDDQKGGNHGRQ